jgi:hypothetical protein
MANTLDALTHSLNRLIEQERFAEAQALLPDYTRALDQRLRENDGEEALKQAIASFQNALVKTRAARSHIAAGISDLNRAKAYTGDCTPDRPQMQLVG